MHLGSKGFTLIELLVVIAIIGMLSSIALVSLRGARESAKRAKAQSEIEQMYKMLLSYNIETGTWPMPCDNMDTPGEWNGAWNTYGKAVTMDPWEKLTILTDVPISNVSQGIPPHALPGLIRYFSRKTE